MLKQLISFLIRVLCKKMAPEDFAVTFPAFLSPYLEEIRVSQEKISDYLEQLEAIKSRLSEQIKQLEADKASLIEEHIEELRNVTRAAEILAQEATSQASAAAEKSAKAILENKELRDKLVLQISRCAELEAAGDELMTKLRIAEAFRSEVETAKQSLVDRIKGLSND